MSKQQTMPMPTGSGPLPKLIGTAIVLALLVMVIQQPAETAGWVEGVLGWAMNAVQGIATFFGEIAS